MYKHILIATDGSAVSARAVGHGLALAKAVGARVTAVAVMDTRVLIGTPYLTTEPRAFDVFPLLDPGRPRHLGVVIADVSGKGIGAAVMMAFVRAVMRSALDRSGDPVAALELTNRILVDERRTGMFVTALAGVLDLDAGIFRFANAGHEMPLLATPDGSEPRWPEGEAGGDNLSPGRPVAYGFGWFLDPWRGRKRMWHHGETRGFRSIVERFPGDGLTVIILANRGDIDLRSLALEIAAGELRP